MTPVPSGNVFPVGTTVVTYIATDSSGNQAQAVQSVTVKDNTPPVITGAAVDHPVLRPPNHDMVPVTVSYGSADNCGASSCTLSVSSNEPGTDEWQVVDSHHVLLRAERNGNGTGRVYTITITCRDANGQVTQQSVTVQAPHNQ